MKTNNRKLLALNLALLLALSLFTIPVLAAVTVPDGAEPVFAWATGFGYPAHKTFTPETSGYYCVVIKSDPEMTPNDMVFYGPDDTSVQTYWGGQTSRTFYLAAGTPYICAFIDHGYGSGVETKIYHADADGNILTEATPTANTAYPSTQTVDVDGTKVEFQCYALKDENGNDTNYIKLRDLADILNGSGAQFQVGWDGNITITTGQAYTKNGTEQNTPFSGERTYEKTAVKTLVDGKETALDTFQLKDDNGGGYTYYKLRDLGKALGITVDWSGERGIFIETK